MATGLGTEGHDHAAKAVSGKDLTDHDARLAQLFYHAAADTAVRDAAGVEPAKATIDDIRALSTVEDVTAFLIDPERSAGAPSFVQVRNKQDPNDDTRYVARVQLSPATFGDSMGTMGMNATMVAPEDDLYQARLACASSVLTRAGMSEDEAKAAFENRVELEQQCIVLGADKHPSAYVDVNGPAQMFEEFYETYDVKEGDGMCLAPDERIALW